MAILVLGWKFSARSEHHPHSHGRRFEIASSSNSNTGACRISLSGQRPIRQRQAFNKGGYRDWASRIRARRSSCRCADATALRLRQRITAGDHRQFRRPSGRVRLPHWRLCRLPGAFRVICLAIALMFLAGRGRGDRMSAADVRVWHEPADPECPLSRRVLEGKRTCHGDRESDVHDIGWRGWSLCGRLCLKYFHLKRTPLPKTSRSTKPHPASSTGHLGRRRHAIQQR